MTLVVSIARISAFPDPAGMPGYHEAHRRVFGPYAGEPKYLRDPDDPNQVAVVVEVSDLDGVRGASRSAEGDALMRRLGILEQLSYFVEDAPA